MASFDWGAFVAGAADTTLKSWETREASDRKIKEAEMLEKLRRETSDYEFKRDTERDKKKVKQTRFDPTTGESIDVNEFGEEVGRRKDQAAIDSYAMDKAKYDLDMEDKRSTISARTERLALDRQELAERRADRKASGGSSSGAPLDPNDPDPYDVANELLYRYKGEAGQAVKSGNISEAAIRAAAVDLVKNSKDGQVLQQNFLRFLGNYQSGAKKTQQRARVDKAIAAKQGLESY